MVQFFNKDMVAFMLQLRLNNNKAFMETHKEEYIKKMRDPHYRLIEALGPVMKEIDPDMEIRPYKALSRIYRDTRYSHNKAPYRDHHWIAFQRQGEKRENTLSYWFEIRLESISLGLGYWGYNKIALNKLRANLLHKPDELLELLPILKQNHVKLEGNQYKRLKIPENLHPDLLPWYKLRELYLVQDDLDSKLVFSDKLLDELSKMFRNLAPLYHYLRKHID